MKTLSLFISLFFLLTLNGYSLSENSSPSPSSSVCCEASGTFGIGSCSVPSSCASCECEGGLVSAKCRCLHNPSAPRPLPSLTSQESSDVDDFQDYLENYGTSSMDDLAIKVQDVIDAINASNQVGYDAAETNYRDTFVSVLSTTEKNDINSWVQSRGYPGF